MQELYPWCCKSGRSPAFGTHRSREWCWKVHSRVTFKCTATSTIKIRERRLQVLKSKGIVNHSAVVNSLIISKLKPLLTREITDWYLKFSVLFWNSRCLLIHRQRLFQNNTENFKYQSVISVVKRGFNLVHIGTWNFLCCFEIVVVYVRQRLFQNNTENFKYQSMISVVKRGFNLLIIWSYNLIFHKMSPLSMYRYLKFCNTACPQDTWITWANHVHLFSRSYSACLFTGNFHVTWLQ